MSRSIGSLTLDLIAKTGSFDQGMDRASRRVRNTANEMEAARRAADRLVAGIAAAAAGFATAAAAMAVSSAKALDATSKMAQQIGTTTESLTGMRFAAQQFANISDQQFDMSMRRMTRRIAEAAEGSGSAKKALEAMGLSARELARLSPDKQMLAIADAMQRTESQADRLRYTMALFDTEGMALVPALQQGAEAFEANIALARQFGVVVSQEAASAAEEFMTNMNLLTEAQKGFKNQVAESVLPVLAEFTGYLVDVAKNAGDMGERVETALKVIGVAAAATATIITSRLVASILKKVGAWGAATLAAARLQAQMTSLSASIAGASRVVSASAGLASGAATVLGRAAQLVLGVLGGPVGLAAAAVITGAAFLAMGRDSRTAATDVDELTRSLENLNRRQLESAAFNLENELVDLSKQAEGHGQILQGLRNDYDALSQAQGVTEGELRNVRQAIREEEEAFESVIATIAKKSPLLAQITQRLSDLDTATRGAAASTDGLNRAMGHSEAGEKYIAQIQGRIKALQDAGDPLKIANRHISEHTDLTEADRVAILSLAHAEKALIAARDAAAKSTKAGTNALNEAKRAAEAFRKEQDRGLIAQLQAVSAIHQQAGALEDQVLLFGQSKTAIEDLAIARLEERAAMLSGDAGAKEQIEIIEREIEARKRLRTAIGSLEQKEAERQAWESWARDVDQVFQQVGQSLTDQLFDGGKRGLDMLKDWAKTLTLRLFVQPVMSGLQAMVTGVGPAGAATAGSAGAGVLNNAGSLFSMFGGNSMGMGISNVLSGLSTSSMFAGTGVGNWMMGTAGNVAGMSNLALGGAGLLGGLGANLLFGGQGHSGTLGGIGSTVGMALGGPIGAVAGTLLGGGLGSLFGDREPTTRREQRTQVEYAGGIFDVTKTDDRAPAGADAAARALAETAVQTANDIFKQVGVDAAIDSFHAIMASSYAGDRDGVASGGTLRIGDELRRIGIANEGNPTVQGFGGWSSAETLPRLATDIQLTVLEAFQQADILSSILADIDIRGLGDAAAAELSATVQMIVQEVSAFQTAVERLPFAQLRDLSFDAAANLIKFAGGLENLDTGLTAYHQHFYSESEQIGFATEQMSAALGALGFVMPDMSAGADDARFALRSFVESLDVTQEEGARAFAAVMGLAGSYSELADAASAATDRALEDARRRGEAFLQERKRLDDRLFSMTASVTEMRERELNALSKANRSIQMQIWALEDLARASEAAAQVSAGFAGVRENILLDQLGGPAAQYDYFKQQADGLARLIPTLTDIDAITRASSQIQSITSRAYGLLDEDQRQEMGGEFLEYLNRTEDTVLRQIQVANKQQSEDNAKIIADAVAAEMKRVGNAIVSALQESGKDNVEGMRAVVGAIGRQLQTAGGAIAPSQYKEVNV